MTTPDSQPRFRLKRFFSIASGVLMLIVALPLAYAYYYSEVKEHTELAGTRNEVLARTYANALWPTFGPFLLDEGIDLNARRSHDSTAALDDSIKRMARDAPVIKIKVYNLEGIAVYSSVLREIGENKGQNSGFLGAKNGSLVNDLTHRGTMSVTEGQIENVDVVSSYIPIHLASDGPVIAVFELYANVTETLSRIRLVTLRLLFALLGVFLLLYLSLLVIVARADTILSRQYADLEDSERLLRTKASELETEIMERREIEKALRQSEDIAASASRAKSEFLSGMSHELRTPMNAILGFAQLLETEPNSPLSNNQQGFVKQILKAARHLLDLINQVLDLAKIEAGKLALSMEPVAVEVLLEESLPMVDHLVQQFQLSSIKTDLGQNWVMADYGRLKQVLLNLLTNAIKYNRPGGGVQVSTSLTGGWVTLEVTDTGLGIPEAKLNDLFQPFSRLGLESGDIEGTGIGLALSKRIVEAMGGKIGVQSTLAVGSTFWISLPVAAPESVFKGRTLETNRHGANEQDGVKRHRAEKLILYVEDNPANVLLMKEIVGRLGGVRMISTHTAELGIAIAHTELPDVIIMDIHLPGMSGLQALSALRASPTVAHIPVIALTANAQETEVARGLAAGFAGYHTKPIEIDEFSRALVAALTEGTNGF